MLVSPVSISVVSCVKDSRKHKNLVSTSFTARFEDGTYKLLNNTRWEASSLWREINAIDEVLSKDFCPLYHLDWSKNPMLGNFKVNYPSQII